MGYRFAVLPERAVALACGPISERATLHLRQFLREVPLEVMLPIEGGLLDAARQRLADRSLQLEVTLRARPEIEIGGLPIRFDVEPGRGGGAVRRLPAGAEPRPGAGPAPLGFVEIGRPLGEPIIGALAHGMVAAAIAEACDGQVLDLDGAWDAALFPCSGSELAAHYLRPMKARTERAARAAHERLRELPGVLGLFDTDFLEHLLGAVADRLVSQINEVRGDGAREGEAFDRALEGMEIVRALGPVRAGLEQRLLFGERGSGPGGAFGRLRPSAEERDRWLSHLGERSV